LRITLKDPKDIEAGQMNMDPIPDAVKSGAPEELKFPEKTVNKNKDCIPSSDDTCETKQKDTKCVTEIKYKTQSDILQNNLKFEHLLDHHRAQDSPCDTKKRKLTDFFTEPQLSLKDEEYQKAENNDLLPEHLEEHDKASTMLPIRTLCDTKEDIDGPNIDQCKLEPELSLKVEEEPLELVGPLEEPLELVGLNDEWNYTRGSAEYEFNEEDVLGPFSLPQQQWMQEPTTGLNGETEKRRKGFPCAQCEYVSRSHQTLLDHIKAIHLGVRFQCQFCDYTTKRKRDLQPHVKQKHEGAKFPCDKCDYVTDRIQSLNIHMKSQHLGVTYPCPECDFVGKYRASLWQHRKTVHQGVQYSCDQCEYKSSTPQNLKEHRQHKHDGINFPCDECDKVSSSAYTLAKHKKNIHGGQKYDCDECDYVGNSLIYLRRHKQKNHGETHSCDQCKYWTNNISALKKHKRKVHEGIRYPCKECGDKFRDPPSLKQHVDSIHRGIRFHCDQCEYAGAANMSILRRHIKAKHGGI